MKLGFLEKAKKVAHQLIYICCRLLWRTACFHRVRIFYSRISAVECVVKNIRLCHFTALSLSRHHLIVYMPGKLTRGAFPTCLAAFYFLMSFALSSGYLRWNTTEYRVRSLIWYIRTAHAAAYNTTVTAVALVLHTSLRDSHVRLCLAVCTYLRHEPQMDSSVFIQIIFRRGTRRRILHTLWWSFLPFGLWQRVVW